MTTLVISQSASAVDFTSENLLTSVTVTGNTAIKANSFDVANTDGYQLIRQSWYACDAPLAMHERYLETSGTVVPVKDDLFVLVKPDLSDSSLDAQCGRLQAGNVNSIDLSDPGLYLDNSTASVGYSSVASTFKYIMFAASWEPTTGTNPRPLSFFTTSTAIYGASLVSLYYQANIPVGASATASADFTGSPLTFTETVAPGSTVNLYDDVDINLSVPGYMFTGWNTEADGTGTPYDALKNGGETLVLTASNALYAQWASIEVTTNEDEFLVSISGTQAGSYQYFRIMPDGADGPAGALISPSPVSVEIGHLYQGEFPDTLIECGVTYTFSYLDARNNTYNTTTPISVEAEIPCPSVGGTSTPYTGPTLSDFSSRTLDVCTPKSITITGIRLSGATASIQGKSVTVLESTDTKLVLAFPAGLTPGNGVDLVINSSSGTLTHQDAFDIPEGVCSQTLSKGRWTQLQSDGTTVKIYAKDPIGDGKIQFFVDGKELAWINAIDESDPKLSFASSYPYLVRSVTLHEGKNRFEIKLDGERVWRATYVPKN